MDMGTMNKEQTTPEHVNISTHDIYRGFRIKNQFRETDYSIDVTGFNVNGHRLIGSGGTLDEAYDNLIDKIDKTLDG